MVKSNRDKKHNQTAISPMQRQTTAITRAPRRRQSHRTQEGNRIRIQHVDTTGYVQQREREAEQRRDTERRRTVSRARLVERDLQTRYAAFKRFLAQFPLSTECHGPGEAAVLWLLYRVAPDTVQALRQQGVDFPSGGACVPSQVLSLRDVGCMWLRSSTAVAAEECKLEEIDEAGAIRALEHCARHSRLTVIDLTLPGHANVALLDNKLGTLERFDPSFLDNVEAEESFDAQMQVVRRLAEAALRRPVQYVPPLGLCPLGYGPQAWAGDVTSHIDCPERSGYCVVFSLMYADLRMQFPDVSPARLVALLLEESPGYLFTMAQQYLSWIRTVIPLKTTAGAAAQLTRLQAQVVQPFLQSHPHLLARIQTLTAGAQRRAQELLVALHVLRGQKQPIEYSLQFLLDLGEVALAAGRLDTALSELRNFQHSLTTSVFHLSNEQFVSVFPSRAILDTIAPTVDFLVHMPTSDANRQAILNWADSILTTVSDHNNTPEQAAIISAMREKIFPRPQVTTRSVLGFLWSAFAESLGVSSTT